MAEIEHYVDPLDKTHKKFNNIKHLKIPLLTQDVQLNNKKPLTDITIEEAVEQKLIDNQTLAYFVARTYQFMLKIGINADGIRARQHLKTEMAHYATDCWDIEIETSYGWVEIVGHADRKCFDLTRHAEMSGVELVASRKLKEPKVVKFIRVALKKDVLVKKFGKDKMKPIVDVIEKLNETDKETFAVEFESNKSIKLTILDSEVVLTDDCIVFERKEEVQLEEKFIPGVIEPAFGIGRTVYCVMEHCFKVRNFDKNRSFFAFPPLVAPVKVSILPLIDDEKMKAYIEPLSNLLN
jgi:glycyl-tRNA synthetase